ncbi:hypothetical protein ABGV42_26235 [Paenibacillus pabuli]
MNMWPDGYLLFRVQESVINKSELWQHELTEISILGRKRRAFLSKRVSYTIMSKEIMGF